jgi:hypothetical protein
MRSRASQVKTVYICRESFGAEARAQGMMESRNGHELDPLDNEHISLGRASAKRLRLLVFGRIKWARPMTFQGSAG